MFQLIQRLQIKKIPRARHMDGRGRLGHPSREGGTAGGVAGTGGPRAARETRARVRGQRGKGQSRFYS